MSIKKVYAIFKKQLKETLKNKSVLLQFIMFPAIAIIMNNGIHIGGMPENYFIQLFATMYVGMAPITSMADIIAEEKEKNTLRVLMMSNVKPFEYLLGVGTYVFILCMLGTSVFAVCGAYTGAALIEFLVSMAIGIFASAMMGAAIGIGSKNQMIATSITVPIMSVCSFLPMLSNFNNSISKVSRFIYSQQVNNLINSVGKMAVSFENVAVISANILIVMILFTVCYRKCGLA